MSSMEEDSFDRLPDALLLSIFNKIADAKSLTWCILVSKRFASLVFETETVFLAIPPRKHNSKADHNTSTRNLFKILGKFIAKPLHLIADKSTSTDPKTDSSYSPKEVLKHFKQFKAMHIELPSDGGTGKTGLEGNDSLLKWKARFGSELKSLVILGAPSFQEKNAALSSSSDNSSVKNKEVLTDDQLKLRVVWTISCLVAASARHSYLLKQVLKEHHPPENITASDVCKQGRFCMGKEEVADMRNSMVTTTASSLERTRVPTELSMKLWYVPVLELPETGYIMRGATLVVIKPSDIHGQINNIGNGEGDLFGFDGEKCEKKAFTEAVREMMKTKKTYLMTMDSF